MALLLLIIIYIDFIGLGIPDSLFGAAWPAIYTEFQLPISYASCITLIISFCTIISSLLSAKLLNRFGTPRVTAISTCMTAGALLGFSISGDLLSLCLFAVPLGLGAGSIDSGLNNYVALHYKASHMNFLHCFYGIGVSLSPYLMSLTMSGNGGWRSGYQTVFLIQSAIAAITVFSLPVWRKAHSETVCTNEQYEKKTLTLRELIKVPALPMVWCTFIASCGLEYTCGTWSSTFLVENRSIPVETAAKIVTLYYVGMAAGRFLSGALSARLTSWKLIGIGKSIVAAAIVLLFTSKELFLTGTALFLIGIGNGPIFPNLIHLTPQNFGADISQSVMGTQMAASYIGIMLTPPAFGLLAEAVGAGLFPYYLLALFIVLLAASGYAARKLDLDQDRLLY